MIENTDWEYEHEQASLDEDLKLIADQLRSDETKKMVNMAEVRDQFKKRAKS